MPCAENWWIKIRRLAGSHDSVKVLCGRILGYNKAQNVIDRWKVRTEMKIQRHSKIVELIRKYDVETQEELANLLRLYLAPEAFRRRFPTDKNKAFFPFSFP